MDYNYRERRQNARHSNIILPAGELTLMYDHRPIDLFKFKDISPFGVCLLAAEPAKQDDVIQIRYHHKEDQLDVYGTMIWQELVKNDTQSHYWLGIRFWPHNPEPNISLFDLLINNLAEQKAS
ncbi:hypothetical protein tinsulaeT_18130 [Thalassotalea insulae]|uniref:PilZ domain-containing protein n=1 Tax=Thalassotalea insulae TaxID=2056778 RepID=A0ABQ6GRA3_9GAMM|nr:PilZ domain-containing protein [Thalassotalea insulae]GLX78473.1 hypothetical protein tinsulaeT_18130 [Thalassotalea insulae]